MIHSFQGNQILPIYKRRKQKTPSPKDDTINMQMYMFLDFNPCICTHTSNRVPRFSARLWDVHFFLVSLSFSFVPPVLDKFIPEYLGPEFKMIGFSFPSREFIYSHATVNSLWMPSICIVSPPFPLGYPKLHTSKTKCTMFP